MADTLSSGMGHRVTAVPASQYLSLAEPSDSFSTGCTLLDEHLGGRGLQRGKILEISGPPGSGKSALGLQLVISALKIGVKSTWIDTSTRMSTGRLSRMLEQNAEHMKNLQIRYTPSLAHLCAILKKKSCLDFSSNSGELLIIDDISTIISREFSFIKDDKPIASAGTSIAHNPREKLADKKQRILGELASTISKLAGIFNTTIIILTRLASQAPYGGGRLVLYPSTSDMFRFWTSLFHHRILLVRNDRPDHVFASKMTSPESSRTVLCLARSANFLLNELSKVSIIFETELQISKNGITDLNTGYWDSTTFEPAAKPLLSTNNYPSIDNEDPGNAIGSQLSSTADFHHVKQADGGDKKRRKIDNDDEHTHDDQLDTDSHSIKHTFDTISEKPIGIDPSPNEHNREGTTAKESANVTRIPQNTIPDSDNEYDDDDDDEIDFLH